MAGPEVDRGADAAGPVVLMCTDCPASRIVFHCLKEVAGAVAVVVEDPVQRRQLVRRRLRRLGLRRVVGQLAFMAVVVPVLERRSRARISEIRRRHGLVDEPLRVTCRVGSVNSPDAWDAVRALRPALVVLCGTRILSGETLRALGAPVVNYHAGVTPQYRGVHGGYWALAEGRPELVGSTVHLVDEGIDTGRIIEQRTFEVTAQDSFVTYPYLHVAAALPILTAVVERSRRGERLIGRVPDPSLPSRLRTHPTAWEWARSAVRRGVR